MTTAPSTFILETFPGQIQQERNWCWAAACASINNYFLHPGQDPLGQCEVANLIFRNNNCCESPDQCDSPSSLASALIAVSHLNSLIPGSAAAVPGGFTGDRRPNRSRGSAGCGAHSATRRGRPRRHYMRLWYWRISSGLGSRRTIRSDKRSGLADRLW
jgi:hypothetical protein